MMKNHLSPYMQFSRQEWASLRNAEPMTLTPEELTSLQGINEDLSIDEVSEIYLPLSRLLNYYINNSFSRQAVLAKFLGKTQKIPYVIGIAGSVAVGKSTTARVLQALLSRWPEHRKVALVTTDGFLYPNKYLEERGIMNKKGFPQSYDIKRLINFVADVKSGQSQVKAPVYSHLVYDIVDNEEIVIDSPDILILEGLNVLQGTLNFTQNTNRVFVSDYVDFSIYVDADLSLLHDWYVNRFLKFRAGAFSDPNSYFNHYSQLPEQEAINIANRLWREINELNLIENILPTRERASLILTKGKNHKVDCVQLRK
ncbi:MULTISPECIES: type I pantothenate kinase [unclassified Gilliamella]|uniref:type I pantothenate kinase n=1 Tax=unclassified Gilliamella TaxID=2685620 RepID=UPI002269809E|nr:MULTISPECIES: type I pantothenate kinase [unclassified Gilliamella]MCX8573521.1 type I pantothenate kinase [Gilliamella sp. B3831]MCX8575851.1 type I pantothenate kinase [Gilliamella sp. B3815]MCX8590052.1 type I pantothenate kinase [Gilliamella sp. B3812]MCX8602953.1 type I pantothenate kinase [Gilliamella sp. B3823]MCX8605250.1 type I pantothenate kinase [Gilliamella sp. B3825]MCX8636949.1 type I pantothenate kinase [Gilliamella sp. B3817]